ncbi:MAG: hypothetical protein F4Y26_03725, partial [Gammaproteobacteria bacterium]|nr:hypothetical protein [Gammaproteobacteria bacterium]
MGRAKMPRVRQTTWLDVLADLPPHVESTGCDMGPTDLLIVAAGFEERAQAILRSEWWPHPRETVIVEYPTNYEDNLTTKAAFEAASKSTTILHYSKMSFVDKCRSIFIERAGLPDHRIVVDISGMSSYVFFTIMGTLVRFCEGARVTVFYAEAEEYFPTEAEMEGLRVELGG